MNIKTSVKEMLHNVKLLSGTTEKGDPYNDKLFLIAEGDILTLLAGTRTSFVVINQEVEGIEDGEICISFSLLNLLKMIRGNGVELKSQKKLSITDGKGFRSSLSLIDTPSVYDRIKVWHDGLSEDYIELNTGELKDLARASLDFPAFQESRWVDVMTNNEGDVCGAIQSTEIGGVENYTFSEAQTDHTKILLSFNPESLLSHLALCSHKVRVSLGEVKKTPSCVSDPDNSNWYGLLTQVVKPNM